MIRENSIEKYLIAQCKKAGAMLRKTQWVGHNHCPDRLVMTPHATVWVELKAPGKVPRPGQYREHDRMRAAGQTVIVIDSKNQVDDFIKTLKGLNNATN